MNALRRRTYVYIYRKASTQQRCILEVYVLLHEGGAIKSMPLATLPRQRL